MQIAYSFDKQTILNIAKGSLHYAAVSLAIIIVDTVFSMLGQVHFNDPLVAAGYVFIIGNIYNTSKEYIKGA